MRITHSVHFLFERDDTWPASLPWPEWKPETDKAFRPEVLQFNIQWLKGTDPKKPQMIDAFGPRLNKNGPGVKVKCIYYSNSHLPEKFAQYVEDALEQVIVYASQIADAEI